MAIINSKDIKKHKINGHKLKIISFEYLHYLHCNIFEYDYEQFHRENMRIASKMAEDLILEIID